MKGAVHGRVISKKNWKLGIATMVASAIKMYTIMALLALDGFLLSESAECMHIFETIQTTFTVRVHVYKKYCRIHLSEMKKFCINL